MTEPPEDTIKAIWLDQETEDPKMTVQAMRLLARSHADSVRDRLLMGYLLIGLEVAVFAWFAYRAPNAVARVGDLLILIGLAWMVWRLRLRQPDRLPEADVSAATMITFHRKELERARRGALSVLLTAVPVLCGIAVTTCGSWLAHPHAPPGRMILVFFMMILWLAGAWIIYYRRGMRRLQQQIDELDVMAKG